MGPIRSCACTLAMLALVGAGGAAVQAQDAQPQLPAFDVVSIKPYGPDNQMIWIRTTPDGISVGGMFMHMIVREAFGVTDDHLLGEPDWVRSNRYDVDAKVAPDDAAKYKQLDARQHWAMLLPVLEERCRLKFHHEIRELEVYDLVVAKGGLKMRPSNVVDASAKQPGAKSTTGVGDKGLVLAGREASVPSIVTMISRAIGSKVVDKTGLTGKYDFELQYAPGRSRSLITAPAGPGASDADAPGDAGPSIFTALQEQLGLKLEARKEPVDVVVIDHMEPPTEN